MQGFSDEPPVQSSPSVPEPGTEGAPGPSLTLPPDVADALKGEHQCQPGDRYNLTVAVRSVGEDGSLTLDVPQDAQFTPAGPEDEMDSGGMNSEDEPLDRLSGPTVLKGVGKSLEY